MKQNLKNILGNPFIRNVATLSFGTILSQVIVISASPFLARIYSVESFGALAIFTSFTAFLAVVSTGRYELTIGLPESEESALKIIKLIISIGLVVSFAYFIIVILLKNVFNIHDSTGFLNSKTAYVAPFYIFFIAVFSALTYWKQRKKQYKLITIASAVQVLSTTFISLAFGIFKIQDGLIWSLMLGIVIGCGFYFYTEKGLIGEIRSQNYIKGVAKEYIAFPKFMTFSDLSMVASQQFIPILFSILYSTTIVGFFSMANRIVRIPNIIITSAIANVFRNDAIDEIRLVGNCESLYKSTIKKLIFISLPVYLVVFLLSPILFTLIFGKQWVVAGDYARIISVFLFFEFVATPFNSLFNIRGEQKKLMNFQLINAIFGAIMIILGSTFFASAYISLVFFSINAIIFNLILLAYSYRIAKRIS